MGTSRPEQSEIVSNGIIARHVTTDTGLIYAVSGRQSGPTLLVTGHGTNPVYRRILSLPHLPWLRGTLLMAETHLPQTTFERLEPRFGPIDGVLNLLESQIAQDRYWSILRFCAEYGMINGRGVPKQTALI